MSKIIPFAFALFGLAAGAGGGFVLKGSSAAPKEDAQDAGHAEAKATDDHADKGSHAKAADDHGKGGAVEYVKLNNQFVVPVVGTGRVTSLVVMSLTLEVTIGQRENIYQLEPKLRDAFLQIMFDHANAGGFDGVFTSGAKMENLRTALREAGQSVAGHDVNDVLIVDIVRQDA